MDGALSALRVRPGNVAEIMGCIDGFLSPDIPAVPGAWSWGRGLGTFKLLSHDM